MNTWLKLFTYTTVVLFGLSACNSLPQNPNLGENWTPIKKGRYNKSIRKNTSSQKKYSGLYLIFSSDLTHLTSNLQKEQLKMQSQYKYWTEEEANKNLNKLNSDLDKKSSFFLSFYTPSKKLNKLHQKSSDWKAVLILNNKTYEGSIKLSDNLNDHNLAYYKHIETWNKNYRVHFPISSSELDQKSFQVRIVSPYGMAIHKF